MAAETLAWIDSTSTSHALDGSSVSNPRHVAGRQGFYAPPIQQLDQRTPLQPGTTIKYTDIQPRIITVPLLIKDPSGSETNFQTQIEAMIETWFANPGTFRSTKPNGTQRDLNCYYIGGMELDEALDSGVRGSGWAYVTPQFEAADPFWYDTANTTVTYTGPFSSSTPTLTTTSGFYTWPVITIHGPSTSGTPSTIQNFAIAGNPYIQINGLSLGVSDNLVIDTTPGKKTAILNGSTNEAAAIDFNSTLQPLMPGANGLLINIPGSTGGTTVQFVYKNRYRSL